MSNLTSFHVILARVPGPRVVGYPSGMRVHIDVPEAARGLAGSPVPTIPEPLRGPYVGSQSLSSNSDLSLKELGQISQ